MIKRMLELARERPRFGYRRIATLLRQEGFRASATRILRLWRKEGLKVPKKQRKRRAAGTSAASVLARPAQAPNDVWCWDFTFDRTTTGSPLKWLSILDEFARERLCLKVDRDLDPVRRSRQKHRPYGPTASSKHSQEKAVDAQAFVDGQKQLLKPAPLSGKMSALSRHPQRTP